MGYTEKLYPATTTSVGCLATVEAVQSFTRVWRNPKDRVNIGFYHEQQKPGGISEINLRKAKLIVYLVYRYCSRNFARIELLSEWQMALNSSEQ